MIASRAVAESDHPASSPTFSSAAPVSLLSEVCKRTGKFVGFAHFREFAIGFSSPHSLAHRLAKIFSETPLTLANRLPIIQTMALNNALAPISPESAGSDLAHITATDRERIADRIASSVSPNTAAAYRSRWNHWTAWAAERETAPLPSDPATVAAYLAELAESKARATVELSRAAIRKAHILAGQSDPTDHDGVRQVLASIRRDREVAERGRGPAKTVSYDQILQAQALAMNPRKRGRGHETPGQAERRGLEDQALLGIGFMGCLRRSELAALRWADLEAQGDGFSVQVRFSKSNQDGSRSDSRFIKNGSAEAVRKLRAVREAEGRASAEDLIFDLTPKQIGTRIKTALANAGVDSEGVSAHSLRRAHATELAQRGASIADICQSGGWQSPDMPVRYASGVLAANNAVARYF